MPMTVYAMTAGVCPLAGLTVLWMPADLWGSFDEPAAGGVTADSRGFSSADPFAATFGEMAGGTGAAGGQQPAATGCAHTLAHHPRVIQMCT